MALDRLAKQMSVYIVESPAPEDFVSKVLEGAPLHAVLGQLQIDSDYTVTVTKDTFARVVADRLQGHVKKGDVMPFLHVSAHGNAQGIGLTDGSFLSWSEFRRVLTSGPPSVTKYLTLCMSTCNGFNACKLGFSEEPTHPFHCVVGPTGEPEWFDTLIGFATFYHQLARRPCQGPSFQKAIKAARAASGHFGFEVALAETAHGAYEHRKAGD